MARFTFTLTKQQPQHEQVLRAQTQADLTRHELDALIKELKANGTPNVGDFATIYVEPEEYTLEVNGETMPVKPQFFPPEYSHIINKLVSELK